MGLQIYLKILIYQRVIINKTIFVFIKCLLCAELSELLSAFFFSVHVEDIILHMFQYIQKLRTEGPQEWVFQECKVSNWGCTMCTIYGSCIFTNCFTIRLTL